MHVFYRLGCGLGCLIYILHSGNTSSTIRCLFTPFTRFHFRSYLNIYLSNWTFVGFHLSWTLYFSALFADSWSRFASTSSKDFSIFVSFDFRPLLLVFCKLPLWRYSTLFTWRGSPNLPDGGLPITTCCLWSYNKRTDFWLKLVPFLPIIIPTALFKNEALLLGHLPLWSSLHPCSALLLWSTTLTLNCRLVSLNVTFCACLVGIMPSHSLSGCLLLWTPVQSCRGFLWGETTLVVDSGVLLNLLMRHDRNCACMLAINQHINNLVHIRHLLTRWAFIQNWFQGWIFILTIHFLFPHQLCVRHSIGRLWISAPAEIWPPPLVVCNFSASAKYWTLHRFFYICPLLLNICLFHRLFATFRFC